jgi:hypothetical protein
MALSCPHKSMAPVLAVAGMVANHHRSDRDSAPWEGFINQLQPGRTATTLLKSESYLRRPKNRLKSEPLT